MDGIRYERARSLVRDLISPSAQRSVTGGAGWQHAAVHFSFGIDCGCVPDVQQSKYFADLQVRGAIMIH
jgi:hypothetical protein